MAQLKHALKSPRCLQNTTLTFQFLGWGKVACENSFVEHPFRKTTFRSCNNGQFLGIISSLNGIFFNNWSMSDPCPWGRYSNKARLPWLPKAGEGGFLRCRTVTWKREEQPWLCHACWQQHWKQCAISQKDFLEEQHSLNEDKISDHWRNMKVLICLLKIHLYFL